jgi:integrase/recombinase XerC
VERQDIESFLAYLGQKSITGTSRRRKLCALRRFFSCLRDNDLVSADPTASIRRPKAEERTPEIIYGHEYKALLYEARGNVRDQAILQVFLQTGIRVGELCALTRDDIDLIARELTVRQGKGLKERIVVLGKAAHHALLTYKTFVRTEAMTNSFFAGWKHGPMTSNTIQKADRIARLHRHLFRHTMSTQYLVAGGDAISLQHKPGQRILAMTSRYVHLANQYLEAIRDRVSPMEKVKINLLNGPHRKR